jgi:glycosyltransferase involved in cell wall biosynthesis
MFMNIQYPKVSILTPNYNHGRFLSRMIESIISQEYPDWEAVIVDDGSTDDSVAVVKRYQDRFPDRIKLLENGVNRGILYSQEKGLREVTGNYVLFRGADDFTYPGFFHEAVSLLEQHPQAAICCGDLAFVDDLNTEIRVDRREYADVSCYIAPDDLVKVMGPRNSFYSHASLVRTKVIKSVDCFNPDLKWLWDFFWYYTFAFRHGICYIPRAVSGARFDSTSYSNTTAYIPGVLRQVMRTLLEQLVTEARDVIPYWMKSGMLNIFPEAVVETVMDTPSLWTPEMLLLIQRPLQEWVRIKESRERRFDLDQQLQQALTLRRRSIEQCLAARPSLRVAVYGAGSHTRFLLKAWRQFAFPEIGQVVMSEPGTVREFEGIPVVAIRDLPLDEIAMVLISSQSFESEMVRSCREFCPNVPLFCFWNPLLGDVR